MLQAQNIFYKINYYLLPLALFFILISPALTNVFVVLSVISSLILIIKNKDTHKIFEEKIFIICFSIFTLLLLSYVYTISEFEQYYEIIKKYIKFLYIPLFVYFIRIQNNSKLVIKYFIYGCTLILFLSYCKYFEIFNFYSFYNFLESLNITKIKSKILENDTAIFQHYIIQGIVFSFFSFLCLYIFMKNRKIIYLILSFFSFFNVLFMNDSRAAYILILILFVLSLFSIIKDKKIKISLIIIFTSLLFTQASDNLEFRIKTLTSDLAYMESNNYNSSLGLRYVWTKVGLDNLKNKPILGYGAGSYKKTSEIYFKKNGFNQYELYITNNPHNEFISLSTQLGFIGLFLFFAFLYFLFRNSGREVLYLGIALTVFISSIFNSAFYDNMLGLFLIIIISILYQRDLKF